MDNADQINGDNNGGLDHQNQGDDQTEHRESTQIFQQANHLMTTAEFSAKFRGKSECYLFLTLDCHAYLPHKTTVTTYFLKDLISAKKRFLKCVDVKHLNVPQYETLTCALLYGQMMQIPEIMAHMPEEKEVKKLPKQFLINVAYSIAGESFASWVKDRIIERNEKKLNEGNLAISIDPVLYEAFRASSHVSSKNGTASQMLKVTSKRRRTHAEVIADKERAAQEKANIAVKLARLAQLEQQLANQQAPQQQQQNASQNQQVMHQQQQMVIQQQPNSAFQQEFAFQSNSNQAQQPENMVNQFITVDEGETNADDLN